MKLRQLLSRIIGRRSSQSPTDPETETASTHTPSGQKHLIVSHHEVVSWDGTIIPPTPQGRISVYVHVTNGSVADIEKIIARYLTQVLE